MRNPAVEGISIGGTTMWGSLGSPPVILGKAQPHIAEVTWHFENSYSTTALLLHGEEIQNGQLITEYYYDGMTFIIKRSLCSTVANFLPATGLATSLPRLFTKSACNRPSSPTP